jgi:hypothetical protein
MYQTSLMTFGSGAPRGLDDDGFVTADHRERCEFGAAPHDADGHVLRSGDRAGLEQEVWALLTLYPLLRMAMVDAVETRARPDPDRAVAMRPATAQDQITWRRRVSRRRASPRAAAQEWTEVDADRLLVPLERLLDVEEFEVTVPRTRREPLALASISPRWRVGLRAIALRRRT